MSEPTPRSVANLGRVSMPLFWVPLGARIFVLRCDLSCCGKKTCVCLATGFLVREETHGVRHHFKLLLYKRIDINNVDALGISSVPTVVHSSTYRFSVASGETVGCDASESICCRYFACRHRHRRPHQILLLKTRGKMRGEKKTRRRKHKSKQAWSGLRDTQQCGA